jgi:hypothetical protein
VLHRDHQEIGAKYPIPAWVRAGVPVFRILLWPFRRWLGRSIAGRVGRVGRLEEHGKLREAFELALASAPMCLRQRLVPFGSWWIFVASAARCASELGPEERRRVIDMLPSAPEPGGVEQATLFDEMSRWRWQENDVPGAIELAKQAIQADPTWPYAYVTLAFYAQRSGRLDPLPFLIDAVRADPEVRHHIESQFEDCPELLTALGSAVRPS